MDEFDYQLALWRVRGIGPRSYLHISRHVESWHTLFDKPYTLIRQLKFPAKTIAQFGTPDWEGVKRDRCWLEKSRCHTILRYTDAAYPKQLRKIRDYPPLLFVEGDVQALNRPTLLAMVGSRKASVYGSQLAYRFAHELATACPSLSVVSGLAYGIDADSHRGVLQAGGCAVAVLANGLDFTYPKAHKTLREQIVTGGGTIVSEFPCGVQPRPNYFPRRNRVISGLSHGVFVVESGLKSGSLITARLAIDYGRDVLTIPGSIHQPTMKGNHWLLGQGAKLVTCVQDIIEELPSLRRYLVLQPDLTDHLLKKSNDYAQREEHPEIAAFPPGEIFTVDDVMLQTGLAARAVSAMLLQFQLQGDVKRVSGGFIR